MANTHLLGACVCIVCSGGAVFGTRHLIGSWFLTAQGYLLDWLGDVTSTVSFCQLSGGMCDPTNPYAYLQASYGCYWTYEVCKIMHFVSSLSDILSLSYLYHFVFISCITSHPLWNQYTDSIVAPCILGLF